MKKQLLSTLPLLIALFTTSQAAAAQSADEAAVAKAVDALRQSMFTRDVKGFEALISENVSYGHSADRIAIKQEFIKVALANKSVMKSLTVINQTVKVTGNHAIVRNSYNGVSELDGKTNNTKIGVLMVWAREDDTRRLYARQAYRL